MSQGMPQTWEGASDDAPMVFDVQRIQVIWIVLDSDVFASSKHVTT